WRRVSCMPRRIPAMSWLRYDVSTPLRRQASIPITGFVLSISSYQPHLMIVIHSLSGGGAERVAADLSAFWVQRGYRVTLVTQADASTDVYPLHPSVRRHALGMAA